MTPFEFVQNEIYTSYKNICKFKVENFAFYHSQQENKLSDVLIAKARKTLF